MSLRTVSLAAALISIAAVAAGVVWYRSTRIDETPPPTPLPPIEDPRLTYEGPFQNIHPGVKYVGDGACVGCHRDIAGHFARHPMGRSMATSPVQSKTEPIDKKFNNPFEKYGDRFRVEERDGKVYHIEERLDAKGQVAASIAFEAKYAVGSGTRGKSYFVEHNGRVFQSPISWFSEKNIWDISPGYPEDYRFNRPVTPKCLVCHCNQVEPIDGATNGYREPVFRGLAIGCERCHGPGEKHVKLRESNERVDKVDHSIVNPKHLSPALGAAICQQCHLQGEQRVWLQGRSEFDFRPGLPLEKFSITFVRKPDFLESFRSVGQFEQMHHSACFKKSGGKLGCVSCHDPHQRPDPAHRVAFFRTRCLNCHEQKSCSQPETERKKKQPDDSCIACHMSKEGSANIPHTAVTDHRILRLPDVSKSKPRRSLNPDDPPIEPFVGDSSKLKRELGIALAELTRREEDAAVILSRMAEPLLQEATRRRPDDAAAWEARSQVLKKLGRLPESMTAAEKTLELQPKLERVLIEAAFLAASLDKPEAAIVFWRRAIDVNPFLARYHLELARLLAQRRDWPEVVASCEAALRLESLNIDARMLFITSLARTGARDRAKAEFDVLMAMRPKNEADLRRAFASLMN